MSNELLRFQTALTNSGTSPCVIAVIGDSISYGGTWPVWGVDDYERRDNKYRDLLMMWPWGPGAPR